jgi:hypothetical protein
MLYAKMDGKNAVAVGLGLYCLLKDAKFYFLELDIDSERLIAVALLMVQLSRSHSV